MFYTRVMHKGVITGVFVVIAALIVVGVITLLDTEQAQAPTTEESQQTADTEVPATDDESTTGEDSDTEETAGQTVEIDMSDHQFSVETIQATPGETVTVELTNNQGIHDFVIDELNVDSGQMASGQSQTVTFTIPEDAAGQTYDFYCSVSNHRALGMEGQLIIAQQ